MNQFIRVLVVTDQPIWGIGLETALGRQPGIAAKAVEPCHAGAGADYDLVIVDEDAAAPAGNEAPLLRLGVDFHRNATPADLLSVVRARVQRGENNTGAYLTRRENQLLALISQGRRNKEIAFRLGITPGTVKIYLSKLFQKVGARDRYELALYGLQRSGSAAASFPGSADGEGEARWAVGC